MELVEIRDLDGPNLFALEPAIKIELAGVEPADQQVTAVAEVLVDLHRAVGLPAPTVGVRSLDRAGHVAVYFPWQWRSFALAVARHAVSAGAGDGEGIDRDELAAVLARDHAEGDVPVWVRDERRTTFAIGITGTNGKTTTTRLLAHIAGEAGKHVGWSSSTGVYIDGEQVIVGDYTGPSGARAVLEDPRVDIAILETARGGLLLRGAGYESNDVGIFLNVGADHLDMQGIETIETLAEVKSVVVRVTRPEGVVVLNADDPLVASYRDRVHAKTIMYFSRDCENQIIVDHLAAGGRAVLEVDGRITVAGPGSAREWVVDIWELRLAYGGAAPHMVSNALAATAGALASGFSIEQIREGLKSFRSDSTLNPGRLNVFDVQGKTIVIDYAHNEDGLRALIQFCRELSRGAGGLCLVVGTAGDRQNSVFEGIGQLAAQLGDRVLFKDTPRYLRGRSPGEMIQLMERGAMSAGHVERVAGSYPDELTAALAALESSAAGDVIAVMCQEDQERIVAEILSRGGVERS